jgi:hypothetical protein
MLDFKQIAKVLMYSIKADLKLVELVMKNANLDKGIKDSVLEIYDNQRSI